MLIYKQSTYIPKGSESYFCETQAKIFSLLQREYYIFIMLLNIKKIFYL